MQARINLNFNWHLGAAVKIVWNRVSRDVGANWRQVQPRDSSVIQNSVHEPEIQMNLISLLKGGLQKSRNLSNMGGPNPIVLVLDHPHSGS